MIASSNLPIRPFGRPMVGAPTGTESAEFDRFAIQELGVPQPTLMENAGRSAALILERLFPRGQVTALVGSGNNGGDALVLLRNLAAWGRPVTAVLVGRTGSADGAGRSGSDAVARAAAAFDSGAVDDGDEGA